MVLRFLMLLAFFIFACADYERDNIYDIEAKNSPYKACSSGKYNSKTHFCQGAIIAERCNGEEYEIERQRCYKDIIEDKCGSGWYNAFNSNLRCQSNVVETKCGNGWYNASNANLKCPNNAIEELCSNDWFVQAEDKRCFLNVVKTKCGNGWYNTADANFECENNVLKERCGEIWFNVATDFCSADGEGEVTKYNTLTDIRDGKTYKIIAIGVQTWMAENLNYNAEGSQCYNNNEINCDIYGRLYSWDGAMEVCPDGWRLPGDTDWADLLDYIGTDYRGFAPLPGGLGFSGYFLNIDYAGSWWSATQGIAGFAYGQNISFEEGSDSSYSSFFNKQSLLNVRCIMED